MNKETLPLELRKLGLTEKEVRVYLAALELGHTTIINIAKHAKISRPTAYEVIKALQNKELISQLKTGRKKLFTAESPDKILGLLRRQRKELEEKEREYIRIIELLKNKYYLKDKRKITIHKGKAAMENLINDFNTTQAKNIYTLITDNSIWPASLRKKSYAQIKKRLGKVEIKELSGNKIKQFPFSGAIIIYDKVIILNKKDQTGILIENKHTIELIKALFKYIWTISN